MPDHSNVSGPCDGAGKGAPLDSVLPGPLLAGTSSGRGDAWLLLNDSGTLHRLLLATGKQQQQQHVSSNVRVETDQPPEPATLVAGAAAGSQAADAVFQVLNAACQGQLGAAAMAQQLARCVSLVLPLPFLPVPFCCVQLWLFC